MKYILGIDIGTTNVKAALYTNQGQEVFVSVASYKLYTDQLGTATQKIEEIKEATFKVIKNIVKKCEDEGFIISFLSFSAAMHSLLVVDKEGEPLTPVFTWADRRAAPYACKLKEQKVASEIYQRTGTPIHSMSPLVKLLWLQNEQPEIMKKAAKFIDIKSYLMHQLLGEYYVDYSIASATGLFNLDILAWDTEILKKVGISTNNLPYLVPTTKVFDQMKPEIAAELSLPLDTSIVIGASDGCLANLGVDAIHSTRLALTIGTSGAIRTVVNQPLTDKKERTFCYYLTEEHWVVGGPTNNGGVVLDWAKENLLPAKNTKNDYQEMLNLIADVQAGADDLFFFPYLAGERAPIWRADTKGTFFGLSLHHKNTHMLRAVLEGINLNLYAVYQAIREVIGTEVEQIQVTGGFTQSDIWLQMLADIFGIELVVADVSESGCFGAAILGLLALGEIDTLDQAADLTKIKKTIYPNLAKHQFYQKHFLKYNQINQSLLKIDIE